MRDDVGDALAGGLGEEEGERYLRRVGWGAGEASMAGKARQGMEGELVARCGLLTLP